MAPAEDPFSSIHLVKKPESTHPTSHLKNQSAEKSLPRFFWRYRSRITLAACLPNPSNR